jgi:hypothetical protein
LLDGNGNGTLMGSWNSMEEIGVTLVLLDLMVQMELMV